MKPSPHRVPPGIAEADQAPWISLMAQQHGLVDTAQLHAYQLTPKVIACQVRAGRWQPVAPRVYATFTGPLPTEARRIAALLYAGPAAALSHDTAAELWGMRPERPGPVHVTVPYNRSAVSQPPLVVVHRSRAFRHIVVAGQPPLTSRADTAIDVAAAEPTSRGAQQVLIELLTQRRVAAEQVRLRLIDRPPRRYRTALEQALERIVTGVQSVLEEHYAVEVETAHGLPGACRQRPVRVDGRTLFEDVVYDHVGIPLTVRLDGRNHLEPDVALRDRRRDNTAELAGRSRLVFGWHEVSRTPCVVAGEVISVLHRRGWQGPLLHCPECPGQTREWRATP
jgi:hypothetical protein